MSSAHIVKINPPASALVEVSRLADRGWLVEVQADAVTAVEGSTNE
jgi:enamine deaminase RidA (YjgF/YER057c/UK114 family)